MVGDYLMVQHDIQDCRDKPDSIGLGSHWLDCHHVQRLAVSQSAFRNEGRFWIDLKKKPYEIPYRSLTPKLPSAITCSCRCASRLPMWRSVPFGWRRFG